MTSRRLTYTATRVETYIDTKLDLIGPVFALRYSPTDMLDTAQVRKEFVSPFLADCPRCHGIGEYDTPHGTVACQACNSRVIQLLTPEGIKFADWGDWIVVRIYNASAINPIATATCDVFSHEAFTSRFIRDEH